MTWRDNFDETKTTLRDIRAIHEGTNCHNLYLNISVVLLVVCTEKSVLEIINIHALRIGQRSQTDYLLKTRTGISFDGLKQKLQFYNPRNADLMKNIQRVPNDPNEPPKRPYNLKWKERKIRYERLRNTRNNYIHSVANSAVNLTYDEVEETIVDCFFMVRLFEFLLRKK